MPHQATITKVIDMVAASHSNSSTEPPDANRWLFFMPAKQRFKKAKYIKYNNLKIYV